MPIEAVSDARNLDQRLARGALLVFKHSPSCPISARAKLELERFLAARPDVPCVLIDVLSARALSQQLAERSGVRHESPQALVLAGDTAVWNASHGAITRAALERAWDARPDAQSGAQA